MRFLSVCSGIEAASMAWGRLGWQAVAFSEIDPFASAVLAERHPGVPNWGDMTKFEEWPDADVDVLVGGTPCQDLSVAGKRAGLAGERSGLFHVFVSIAKKYKPKYIVWENVPGALSTNEGKDIQTVIDSLTQIGYACDIDILDAQCFGLAQRRRRIFIACVRLEDLLKQKTPTSTRIAGELLLQPLQDTWAAILQAWCPGKSLSNYEHPIELSADFARKRMTLLEAALDGSACMKLLNALGASQVQFTDVQTCSASALHLRSARRAGALKQDTGGLPSTLADAGFGAKSIATSWNNILDALYPAKSKSTTKTSTRAITASEICTFAGQCLSIVRSIIGSKNCSDQPPWSADYWNLASFILTTLEAVTVYARQATEDLFSDASLRDDWRGHLDSAEQLAHESQRNFGNGASAGALFSFPDSLQGNPAPRRQARETVAPTLSARTKGGGGLGTDFDCDGGLIAFGGNNTSGPIDIATAQTAHGGTGRLDFESETFIAHALKGEGFDGSEDGTGRGTPIVPVQGVALRGRDGGATAELTGEVMTALRCGGGGGDKPHVLAPICFDETQITSAENRCNPQPGDASHPLAAGARPPTICFSAKDHGADAMSDCAPTLRAGGHSESHANAGVMPAIAFHARQDPDSGPVTHPLDTDGTSIGILHDWRVRRLTPLECARLQGFPDSYLDITYRGKPAADGPKYRALGNSMAVNCMAWIGQRIELVTTL